MTRLFGCRAFGWKMQQSVHLRTDYADLHGLRPLWEEIPHANKHLLELGRAGKLESLRISIRESRGGRTRETTKGWTLGRCSRETNSDWHGASDHRYEVVLNDRALVSYAEGVGSGGAGSSGALGTWRRTWFESLKDVAEPGLLYQFLAMRLLSLRWEYLGKLDFFAFGAGTDPGHQDPFS
jgi:hypothetical protein